MKKRLLFFILSIVGIVLLWFFLNQQSLDHSSVINVISHQPDESQKTDPNKLDPTPKTSTQEPQSTSQNKQQQNLIEDTWSYMQLYQKYRLAYRCYDIYQSYHVSKDEFNYVNQYTKNYQYRNNNGQESPTAVQLEKLENFHNKCLFLQEYIATIDGYSPVLKPDNYWNTTHVFIEELLLNLPTSTDDERYLKKTWKLRHTWLKTLDDLLLATHGENTLSDEEIATIKQQIKDLRTEWWEQRNALAEAFTVEMGLAYDQLIESLQKQLKDQLHVNIPHRTALLEQWESQTLALEARLISGPAESFQVITETLNLTFGHSFKPPNDGRTQNYVGRRIVEKIPELKIFSDRLMELSEVRMPRHFDLLYPIANQWHMCDLGLACDENSEWITNRCLGIVGTLADPKSCDLSVEPYLLDYLISPNQAIDINGLKALLQDLYGS